MSSAYHRCGIWLTALCLVSLVSVWLAPLFAGAQSEQPRSGSPPLLRTIQLAFPTQDNASLRPLEDYLQMMSLPHNHTSRITGQWIHYAGTQLIILNDAEQLWRTGWFHSLWVDVVDERFDNGVVGKRVIFNFVERMMRGNPPTGLPEPPPGYETPPALHERVYPPSSDR